MHNLVIVVDGDKIHQNRFGWTTNSFGDNPKTQNSLNNRCLKVSIVIKMFDISQTGILTKLQQDTFKIANY